MNILTLSRKNILAKPLNTFMSILLFALSVGLITFLTLFNDQLKRGLENNLASIDLVIGAKGSPLQLILSSMYHIDAPTGNIPIEEASPFLNNRHPLLAQSIPLSLGDSYGAYRIVGTPHAMLSLYGATQVEGDLYREDFEVVVGSVVAKKLHLHVGDSFYSTHGLEENEDLVHDHGAPFVIKGIIQTTGTVLDQLILCTPQTVWKVHDHDHEEENGSGEHHDDHDHGDHDHGDHDHGDHDHGDHDHGDHDHGDHDHGDHDHAHHVHTHLPIVNIDSNEIRILSDTIMSQLRAQLEKEITSILIRYKSRTNIQALNMLRNINANTGMMAASPAIEINRLYSMMGSGTDALRYLAILIAIVAAISIFISLYTSLRERRYEMALMRVSGAGPGKLFQMIIAEGLWIAGLGLILGLAMGHIGMELAGGILERGYKYQFTGFTWIPGEIWIIAGALVVGLLAAIIPAWQGARIGLHKTLAEG